METATIDPDGISATITTEPFPLAFGDEEVDVQIQYSMTEENGSWLVDEAVIFVEGNDPEEAGDEIFPDQ